MAPHAQRRGRRGIIHRLLAATATSALALAGVLVAGSAPAAATFATQCSAPTRTLAPGPDSISVADGETVLLSGGAFPGGIDALPQGGRLCVAAGSTLSPAYMNN
ncbi:MAG TPA: hypothetical protein VGI56_09455, partial [Galbitalea sp.]